MTNEETIKVLKILAKNEMDIKRRIAYETAVNELEMRTIKKPIKSEKGYICPSCSILVSTWDHFCAVCGQKLR